MTTATEDRLVKLVETARAHVTWRTVAIVVLAIALVGVYCAGRSNGRLDGQLEKYHDNLALNISATEHAKDVAKVHQLELQDAIGAANVARGSRAKAVARIARIDDSTVSIDHGPPVHVVPASVVLPEIRLCADALAKDSTAWRASVALMADKDSLLALMTSRFAIADRQLKAGHSRFNFKAGLLSGIALAAGLVKLLR